VSGTRQRRIARAIKSHLDRLISAGLRCPSTLFNAIYKPHENVEERPKSARFPSG
jgi:hypothetical protein